jgi:hypothetical protein
LRFRRSERQHVRVQVPSLTPEFVQVKDSLAKE